MKRNVRFWTRYTWECFGAELVIAAILGALTLFSADGLDFSAFASVVPYFLCIAAVFGILTINMGTCVLYFPLLVSMGEPRRNVLLGFYYCQALIIAVTTALCSLIWLLLPGEVAAIGLQNIPTILCVLIFVSAAGSIMGTIFLRWKPIGIVLVIICCSAAGGLVGFSSVSIIEGEILSLARTVELTSRLTALPWWLLAAAAVALAVDVALQWPLLRRMEVKL